MKSIDYAIDTLHKISMNLYNLCQSRICTIQGFTNSYGFHNLIDGVRLIMTNHLTKKEDDTISWTKKYSVPPA